jgi:serine/threonine-protein kinase HipA
MYSSAYVFTLSPYGDRTLVGEIKTSSLMGEFQYDSEWLDNPWAYPLDPVNLPLSPMRYRVHNLKNMFGVFSDAGPDSWGERVLLQHHRSLPRNETERLLRLSGMGVGCLQFSLSRTRPKETPPLPTIDRLLRLSKATENLLLKHQLTEDELVLLDPGSSMGGARPKVTVRDGDTVWLVKFSRPDDLIDIPRVEYACMQLLSSLGITVPETKLMTLHKGKSAYMIKRFDRITANPIHFISAHSLFNTDRIRLIRNAHYDPCSYIALAKHLRAHSAYAIEDCHELYSRMVANVLLNNTDDHARNHAMIFDLSKKEWRLAPAFDVLPSLSSQGEQALGIGSYGRESSIENLLTACGAFGLSNEQALKRIDTMRSIILEWEYYFSNCGVTAGDLKLLKVIINKKTM